MLQSDAGKTHTYRVGAAYQGSRGNQYYDSYTMSYSIGLALENHPPRASGCLTCNGGCSIGGGLVIPPELWTPSSTPLDLEINFAVWEGKTAATDYSCAGDGPKLYTRTCRISMEDYAEAETNVYRCVGDGGYLLVYFYWRDASTQAPPTPSPPTPSPPTPAPPLMCSAFSCPDNWSPKAGNVACTTRHLQADMCGGISIKDGSTGSARCCSHNGADCVTTDAGGSCYGDTLTYSQAMDVCALDGRRLCTVAELTQCCGTGCSYDYTHVWVSDVVLSDVVPVGYCDKETCCDVAPTPAPPTPSPPTPSPPPVTNPPATIPPAPTAVPCTRDVVTVVQFADKDNRQLPVPPSEETLFGGAVQVDMHVIINAYTNYGRFVDIGNGVSSDNFIIGQYKNTGYLYVSSTWTSPKLRVIREKQLPLGETFHLRVICVPIDDATSTYYVYIDGVFVKEGVSEALRYVTRSQLLIGVSSFTIAGIPHIDLDGSVTYCVMVMCPNPPATYTPPTPSPPTPSPPTPRPPTYIGCYGDTNVRDLDGALVNTHASPELCSEYCLLTAPGAPYRYMGLQLSTWCLCGNSYGAYGSVPESHCSMSCAQDPSSMCGNYWLNSVYEIGF